MFFSGCGLYLDSLDLRKEGRNIYARDVRGKVLGCATPTIEGGQQRPSNDNGTDVHSLVRLGEASDDSQSTAVILAWRQRI